MFTLTRSLLVSPTNDETTVAVGQYSGLSFFPHALSPRPASGPRYAVFRIEEGSNGEAQCLVITANHFNHTWRSVISDFLVFAEAQKLSLCDMTGVSFHKDSPGSYTAEPFYQKALDRWVFPNAEHPELQPGEVLLHNSTDESFKALPLLTKRRGTKAYNIYGDLITHKPYFPVFAQRTELLAAEEAQGRT